MKGGFEAEVRHGLESVEAFPAGRLGVAHRGENLGCEDHSVRIHGDTYSAVGPRVEHVLVVILGAFPEADENVCGIGVRVVGGGHVFAHIEHVVAFACDQSPAFETNVAHVFAIQREGSAVLPEILAVLLREAFQACMALEFLGALAVAIIVDFLKQPAGDRGVWMH